MSDFTLLDPQSLVSLQINDTDYNKLLEERIRQLLNSQGFSLYEFDYRLLTERVLNGLERFEKAEYFNDAELKRRLSVELKFPSPDLENLFSPKKDHDHTVYEDDEDEFLPNN